MVNVEKKSGFLVPFGFVITFIMVLFVASTSIAIQLSWYSLSKESSLELLSKINHEIAVNLTSYSKNIFDSNGDTLNSINELIAKEVIDLNDKEKAKDFFLSKLSTNPKVSWISYGWPDGSFIGAQRVSRDIIKFHTRKYNQSTKISHNIIYHYQSENNAYSFIKKEESTSKYNATQRSWYKVAIKNDGISWTPVYVFSTSKKPGINVAMKNTIKGKTQGVSSIAIELDSLSKHIENIKIGKTGSVFIMDNKERLIASKDFPKIMKNNSKKDIMKNFFNIKDSKDNSNMNIVHSVIKDNNINLDNINGIKKFIYLDKHNGNIRVTLSKVPGVNLTIAIILPEVDFLGEIQENAEILFVLILFMILISMVVVTVLIRYVISRPIESIIKSTNHMKIFDLEKVSYTHSRIKETRKLADAIDMMRISLISFKKYIPFSIVKDLLNNNIEAKIGGREEVVSIFFSDIEDFINVSEKLGVKLFPHLDEYFSNMSNEIKHTNGTIDKYLGDGIMAFWNAPVQNNAHPKDICLCALNCQKRLATLRLKWQKEGKPLLYTRIGINTGKVMVGNMGSDYKMEYTVLGDSVNLTSRLESINKIYKTNIIISEYTYELVKDDFILRKLDFVALKGRKEGITIYELLDEKDTDIDFNWIRAYEDGLDFMHNRELNKAIDSFSKVSSIKGIKDFASSLMIERCKSFIKNGDFSKILKMKHK